MRGETERSETLQPGEEKAQGRYYQWVEVPDGRE